MRSKQCCQLEEQVHCYCLTAAPSFYPSHSVIKSCTGKYPWPAHSYTLCIVLPAHFVHIEKKKCLYLAKTFGWLSVHDSSLDWDIPDTWLVVISRGIWCSLLSVKCLSQTCFNEQSCWLVHHNSFHKLHVVQTAISGFRWTGSCRQTGGVS